MFKDFFSIYRSEICLNNAIFFLYQSTVILDVDMWNVYKNPSERIARSDSDVFYCFLGDTCMTGRGFRDESCSRGLSTVTVENVRFASTF